LEKNLLVRLAKVADQVGSPAIIGPKIYFAPGFEYHKKRYQKNDLGKVFWYAGGKIDWQNIFASHQGVDEVDHGQYETQQSTPFVSGCAMLVDRKIFEKIGLLDDKYFLYLEDLDFCVRARRAGFKIIYAPQAWLWHKNAGSSTVGGDLHDYFLTRNRMLFGFRYANRRTKFALFRETLRLLKGGRPWQKIGIRDFYWRRFGQGSWK
jgi:GT2 family glycosyltransferase